ncbi:protein of unknown function [Maridesulfovibrio hydrothermalis AM13 = DSM 14728]|uniref:Uncharacterized protein n=1 Tax=Maridesulfovibrio hydrothermalis AM13 = DSM 14728 TaxID=1121451 RepID=L0R9I0_9BACT|nr:protein of unknown function [Maridesulfovibrio hydrothermalis AM13 = DSM 14728]
MLALNSNKYANSAQNKSLRCKNEELNLPLEILIAARDKSVICSYNFAIGLFYKNYL